MIPQVADILQHGMHGIAKEERPAQLEMATDIENLYREESGILIAEGGTGIGKSLAYLVPTVLQSTKRVIISTPTTGLQDQLGDRDIPLLIEKLGLKNTRCGVYKGANNFGCHMLVEEVPKGDERDEYEAFLKLAKDAERPADRKNWVGLDPRWWDKVHAKNCPLTRVCDHAAYCKPNPQAMDIVVTNHRLTGIDMMLGPGKLFGSFHALVLDEGHKAPEYIAMAFKREVTRQQLKRLQAWLEDSSEATELRNYITSSGLAVVSECEADIKNIISAYHAFYKDAHNAADPTGLVDVVKLGNTSDSLHAQTEVLAKKLLQVSKKLADKLEELQGKRPRQTKRVQRLAPTMSKLKKMTRSLLAISTFCEGLKATGRKAQIIKCEEGGVTSKPRMIGPTIEEPMSEISHKIVVSATLTFKGKFDMRKQELGLDRVKTLDKVYKTPFKVSENTVLFTPTDVPLWIAKPSPERTAWVSKNAEYVSKLTQITEGRTLVLFVSAEDMLDVANELTRQNFWNTSGITLCMQGTSQTQTLNKFLTTPKSVIFGLESFGEGVDIPGDDLISVIITRLPFLHPEDDVFRAWKKELGDYPAFEQKSVPHMTTKMRQWCGRLMRRSSDRGFITITDGKVWTSTGNKNTYRNLMEGYYDEYKKWVPGYQENPNKPRRKGYATTLLDILDYNQVTDKLSDVEVMYKRWFK